jgi:hypothetical protein
MRLGRLFDGWLGAPKPDREILNRVKGWAAATLESGPATAITVNEIVCTDPSCPGIETVVLVMAPGQKTRAYKVSKAADEVTEQDIRDALV